MSEGLPTRIDKKVRNVFIAFTIASVMSACATTGASRKPARIEVQDQVGFTITEEARISNNIRVDYDAALDLLEQGRLDEGIARLELVAETAPELSAPRIDLGIAYHRVGKLDAAETQLRLALAANSNHPTAYNELGIVFRKTGRFTEAKQSYESALAIYPGYHFARRNLAVLCDLYLVDLTCALENYEAYMETVPEDDEVQMWITDIRNRIGQ
jgi:tetratricopeptide (TPR) repeat protein